MNKRTYNSDEEFYRSPDVKQEYKEIMKVTDRVLDDFVDGKEWDYLNESTMNSKYMGQVAKRNKSWANSKMCIYPGCGKTSIRRSHTIQKSGSIDVISENNHVLTPMLIERPSKLEYIMKHIGVNEASTFPGFCIEHEKLFHRYEKNKKLMDAEDYRLQIYRTICREIVFNESELTSHIEFYNTYKKEVENVFIKELEKEYGKSISELGLESIKVEENNYKKHLYDNGVEKYNNTLQSLHKLHDACFNNDIFLISIKIPFQIPVAIAGISNVRFSDYIYTEDEDSTVVVNLLPLEGETDLIISSLFIYKDSLLTFVEYIKQTPLTLLNFIESFIINGSEHLFFKESVWEKLSEVMQRQMINDIFYSDWSFGKEYEYSILNDIRKQLIDEAEEVIQLTETSESFKKHIDMEKKKLRKEPDEKNKTIIDLLYEAVENQLNN